VLPNKAWASYEETIRAIGELRNPPVDPRKARDWDEAVVLLQAMGLLDGHSELTSVGQQYFHARFIDADGEAAKAALLHQLLEQYAPAQLIAQTLANRPRVPRAVAETVLRSQGAAKSVTDRQLGSLLALLHTTGIIEYSKQQGSFRVLATPLLRPDLPSSIFISKDTPWSNRRWLHRLVAEADDHLYWLDKHWLPAGLDVLGEAADGERLDAIKILSLELPDSVTRSAARAYRDLGREMQSRGIAFEWRFIDSKKLRDTHDRWMISRGRAWNIPNLNAILSGQHSEMVRTANEPELRSVFGRAWALAPERPY
jgi:hypothetical protein